MKIVFLFAFLVLGTLCSTSQTQTSSPERIKEISGFSHPESVVLDTLRNVLYVSNMGGRDGKDGFISRVSTKGEILDTVWIADLRDPKGLLVKGDKLYTTDVTEIIEVDIDKSVISKRIPVDGAESLNDIAMDENGDLLISDLVGNRIYKMQADDSVTPWITELKLERPNGLLVSDGQLYVGSWGKDQPGKLLRVDRETKSISPVSSQGIGNLDGVQEVKPGVLLLSDWGTGDIYQVTLPGEPRKLLSTAKSSGDILYIKEKNELVVPMNHQNALWWYLLP